jgi:hypothetical protein
MLGPRARTLLAALMAALASASAGAQVSFLR